MKITLERFLAQSQIKHGTYFILAPMDVHYTQYILEVVINDDPICVGWYCQPGLWILSNIIHFSK